MHLFTKISYLFIKVIGLFAKKCYIANALAKKKKKLVMKMSSKDFIL